MKNFLLRITIFVGIFVLALYIWDNVLASMDKYTANYVSKCERLKNAESPRLVFLGGSNLAYGLDSKRIADSLHVNVVNTGLSASLGLRFILDEAEPFIRQGDIVVIQPEYGHFFGTLSDGDNIGVLTTCIAKTSWHKLMKLNAMQIKNFVAGSFTLTRRICMKKDASSVIVKFNEYGDEIGHWNEQSHSSTEHPTHAFDAPINVAFIEYMEDKLNFIKKRATVVMMPPIIVENAYDVLEGNVQVLDSVLRDHNYPFLVSPKAHVLPSECYFDFVFHVNKKGVDIITPKLIEELRPIVTAHNERLSSCTPFNN